MQKLHFSHKTIPWALLILCFLAFGILIPELGFYWDDWPMMWFAHAFGPLGFPGVFSGDRPFLSLIYIVTTSILKTVPWQWQVLGVISRWLVALVFWWTLRQLWPQRSTATAWMAILLAIYPGFKQMPISVVYSNGLFLVVPYIASFGLMIQAIRKPERYWFYTITALLTYGFCLFSTEYYVGTDMLRGVFIWIVLSETIKSYRKRVLSTLKQWLPYLGLLAIFLVWRVFIFKFPTYQPEFLEDVNTKPISSILTLVNRVFQDLFTAGWSSWSQTFAIPKLEDFLTSSSTFYWVLTFGAILISLLYLLGLDKDKIPASKAAESDRVSWSKQAVLTGLIGLVVPGAPYWVTGLPLTLNFPYDRFHLAFMIGSCIFLIGFIELVIRTRTQKVILLSLLVGMSIGTNLLNANTYRREWNTQKNLFWQLSWRVPALKPNTFVLTDELPLRYYSDNSLTAPLNWLYAPDNRSTTLPYYLGFTRVRLGASLPALEEGYEIKQVYRNVTFTGSTSSTLVFFYSPPNCLRIIDPRRDSDLPIFPQKFYATMQISNPNMVITDTTTPAQPPAEIFGRPSESNWCYYYEKADLARQQGNWQEVARLGDEGIHRFYASEPSELLVFIEGYAHTGNWLRAIDLVYDVSDRNKNLQRNLCNLMTTLEKQTSPDNQTKSKILEARTKIECP
jgi:hypothetical protein